ncbi:MAG TPA: CDP-diacylglycerol--serine O-phosphatidyltransferase [Chthoniobacteraceae bacterium]|nr:CDP-diacylglycerol--serine O-phosphatidyltransferase [Chthoniobacteraceae bacterium]
MSNNQEEFPKIYLLPNLMTAGNLFCGFAATLRILEGTLVRAQDLDPINMFHQAIGFILGACLFDLLDGRLARMGGHESEFGREFDSLADVVSFGIAPALLMYQIVLRDFDQRWGLMLAFIYLLCGAMRLARFNCIAARGSGGGGSDFQGFPIPAAAGVIASVTLFILWVQQQAREIGNWKYLLALLMLFLSFMMFSKFRYPSFKALNWRTKKSASRFLVIFLLLIFTVMNYMWMPAVIFIAYLLYGFFRSSLPRQMRRELEDDDDQTGEPPRPPAAT